jgi:hypothetical protein
MKKIELELWRSYQKDKTNLELLNLIVEYYYKDYKSFVYVTGKLDNRNDEYSNLVNEYYFVYITSINNFKLNKGTKFTTYLYRNLRYHRQTIQTRNSNSHVQSNKIMAIASIAKTTEGYYDLLKIRSVLLKKHNVQMSIVEIKKVLMDFKQKTFIASTQVGDNKRGGSDNGFYNSFLNDPHSDDDFQNIINCDLFRFILKHLNRDEILILTAMLKEGKDYLTYMKKLTGHTRQAICLKRLNLRNKIQNILSLLEESDNYKESIG